MSCDIEKFNTNDLKNLYFHIFENIEDPLFLLDREGRIIECNNHAKLFLKCNKEHILNKYFLDFIKIPLVSYSIRENNFYQISNNFLDKRFEFSFIKNDGNHLWLSTKISLIKFRNSSFYLAICKDITVRKSLELNTNPLAYNLEDLYKQLVFGVSIFHVVDGGRDFIFKDSIKASYYKNFQKKGELVGHSILELFPHAHKFEIFRTFRQVYNSGKPDRIFLELNNIKGKERKIVEYYVLRLSNYEIITISNDPLEKFDLKKLIGDLKKVYFQIKINNQTSSKKLYYEKVINLILFNLIGTININEAIINSLKDLCNAVNGSRAFLFLFDKEREFMENSHEWCANHITTHQNQFRKIPINQFEWSMKKIFKGIHVQIPDVSKLSVEAESLRKLLVKNGIRSNIFLPIYISGSVGGFIGIDDEYKTRNWDNEDINLMRICSQIIGNAYERKHFEEKLESSEKKYRSLFNKSAHLITLITLKGEIIDVNETALEILKKNRNDLIGKYFRDFIKIEPKNLKILKSKLKEMLVDGYFKPIEFNIKNENIELEWIKLDAVLLDLNHQKLIQITIQDITKSKKLELMLIETGQQYRNILESITEAIHVVNNKLQIIFINSSFLNWLEALKIPTDIIDKNIFEVFRFLPKKIEDEYRRVLQTGKPLFSSDIICYEDKKIITETQKIPMFAEGKVDQVITIVKDITASFNAQELLKESEEKYKRLFKESPLPIMILDQDGIIIDGNPAIQDIFNYKLSDLIGQDFKSLRIIPSVHIPKVLKAYKNVNKRGITEPVELQIYTSDRKLKWIIGQASFVNLNKKKVIQIIVQDIDDIKQSKFKILESEIKYKDVLDNINEGYFEIDVNGKLLSFNNALCKELGYSKQELMNKHFSIFFDDHNEEKINRKFRELYNKGEGSILFDYEVTTKDGEKKYHESSAYLKYNSKGQIIGFRGLSRDISERKKVEVLRDKFKEKLEKEVEIRTKELNEVLNQQKLYLDQIIRASNFKTEFLSTMSHELRTPLNAIIGFTDLLLGNYYGQLNYDQRDFIIDIEESSNHLLDMITNILDISKIESGEISLDLEEVQPNLIVKNVISTLQPLFNKKHLKVDVKGLSEYQIIMADKIKLKQIIYNLLSNAIKFTEKGTITFEFKEKADQWVFRVKDTGIGIDEQDFDLIFKDFKRVNSPYVNSIPGSGLGLALTKRLIDLNEGEIFFTSKVGKGTTFTFTLPKSIKGKENSSVVERILKLL